MTTVRNALEALALPRRERRHHWQEVRRDLLGGTSYLLETESAAVLLTERPAPGGGNYYWFAIEATEPAPRPHRRIVERSVGPSDADHELLDRVGEAARRDVGDRDGSFQQVLDALIVELGGMGLDALPEPRVTDA